MADRKLKRITEELGASPMFQLSLASKELFHSNFLYWIWKIDPEAFKSIIEKLYNDGSQEKIKLDWIRGYVIKREAKNFDLSVWRGDDSLLMIIENKIKSVPRKKQLDEYQASVGYDKNIKYLLLSLCSDFPEKTAIEDAGWRIADYCSLAKAIEYAFDIAVSHNREYKHELVRDYCKFIRYLHEIVVNWSIKEDTEWLDILTLEEYKDLRIDDLHKKLFAGFALNCLVTRVKGKWKEAQIKWGIPVKKIFEDKEEANFYVNFGMTNSTGFFEIKVKMDSKTIFVIQVQGDQYRRAIEKTDSLGIMYNWLKKNECSLRDFFVLTDKKDPNWKYSDSFGAQSPFRKNKKEHNGFCKYEPSFLYQYVKIPNRLTIDELITAVLDDIEHAQGIKNKIIGKP